ncbi:hypothetical protein BC827DRAFT_1280646, partial [Russula dissimulans]
EVGHVKDCAYVVFVLCFADDSSQKTCFISKCSRGRMQWLIPVVFAGVSSGSSWFGLDMPVWAGYAVGNGLKLSLNQTKLMFGKFCQKPSGLVSSLGNFALNQTKPNFPNTNFNKTLSIITLVLAAQHNYPRHKKQGCLRHNEIGGRAETDLEEGTNQTSTTLARLPRLLCDRQMELATAFSHSLGLAHYTFDLYILL